MLARDPGTTSSSTAATTGSTGLEVGRQHATSRGRGSSITADDEEQLQRILMRLQTHGANMVDPGRRSRPAPTDGVFPEDFYSTTNLETQVRLRGPG